ncbi:MAG: hypothetical protein GYA33_03125, partial [Thermogutta sp.]|nr:hypothetical protein [Thermogutta sp.]
GAGPVGCAVADNWLAGSFALSPDSIAAEGDNWVAWAWPLFVDPAAGDFRLRREAAPARRPAFPSDRIVIPAFLGEEAAAEPPAWRYVHPAAGEPRSDRGNPVFGGQPIAE